MRRRAQPSGLSLSAADAALVKAMLARGDRQHDIAAWFGVNGGRIADIATGKTFRQVAAAVGPLPPPGPYPCGRDAHAALQALSAAEAALELAKQVVVRFRRD